MILAQDFREQGFLTLVLFMSTNPCTNFVHEHIVRHILSMYKVKMKKPADADKIRFFQHLQAFPI